MTIVLQFLAWYFAVTIIGWLGFPLAFRLLPALPDRGYSFTKALSLLLWGFVFWLLASLQILHNDYGGLLFSLAVLLTLSIVVIQRGPQSWKTLWGWISGNKRYIMIVELLFFGAFALWTFVRAANPEAIGTEKPMELAFINAILHSPTFPPHDPWLSGYAISYYYFGYIIVAMLAMLTRISGSVAFNLGISLTFSLTAVSAYGLVYNLLTSHEEFEQTDEQQSKGGFITSALLGPLFILIVSNLEGFLHSLHNRGLFWSQTASGEMYSKFWTWLDIKDLNVPPMEPLSWIPQKFWWWWRASRVIQDYDLAGNAKEIIDEFPFFSYLLGDLHPHVLAMPFFLLCIGLGLNLVLGGGYGKITLLRLRARLKFILIGALLAAFIGFGLLLFGLGGQQEKIGLLGLGLFITGTIFFYYYIRTFFSSWNDDEQPPSQKIIILGSDLYLNPLFFIFSSIIVGAMAFLNTWDFPVSVGILAGAYTLQNIFNGRQSPRGFWKDFFWSGFLFGISGIFFYFLFYISFSSQAGGFIPNSIYITRGAHFWVMFAPLIIPILIYLSYQLRKAAVISTFSTAIKRGTIWTLKFVIPVFLLTLLTSISATFIPIVGDLYISTMGATDKISILKAAFTRRIISPGAWLTLMGMLILTTSLIWLFSKKMGDSDAELNEDQTTNAVFSPANTFLFILILFASLIVFIPEFFYLRDQFGWRINTIFKFYYQAWILWSIASAYAFIKLIKANHSIISKIIKVSLYLILGMSLVYPILSTINKTNNFKPNQWTLDGAAYFQRDNPAEMRAIQWLQNVPLGIVAEAVPANGGSYSPFARVSTLSGFPAVLGWVGHESQWRGGVNEIGSRQEDLAKLYCSHDWEETKQILDEYHIRYIYIGSLERTTYVNASDFCQRGLYELKFQQMLSKVFDNAGITIYEYTGN